jgi:hypothetical protein
MWILYLFQARGRPWSKLVAVLMDSRGSPLVPQCRSGSRGLLLLVGRSATRSFWAAKTGPPRWSRALVRPGQ